MSEEELIKKCIDNNHKAQKTLYDMYAPIMLGVCIRYVHDIAEAEDILQEGFLKVFKNIKDFANKGSFEGWMKRIFINTAITHYRKNLKNAKYQYDINNLEFKIEGGSIDYGEADFTQEELLSVIKSLPQGYRIVFNLYAVEGYKHKEIADILGIDESTSKSQYARAKKVIKHKLTAIKNSEKRMYR